MKTLQRCVATLAGIGILVLVAPDAAASSAVPPGRAAAAAVVAENAAYRLQSGRISGIDAKRGVLVVDGQTYRLDARTTALSDDRADPPAPGLAGLRVGDKVIVRSVRSSGVPTVIQLVVKD